MPSSSIAVKATTTYPRGKHLSFQGHSTITGDQSEQRVSKQIDPSINPSRPRLLGLFDEAKYQAIFVYPNTTVALRIRYFSQQ
jgi:hypothetical protein